MGFAISVLLTIFLGLQASQDRAFPAPGPGIKLTIATPEVETVELAFDEVELHWAEDAAARRTALPEVNDTERARLKQRVGGRAVFASSGARTLGEMRGLVQELEARNPGGAAHLVLYRGSGPRSDATRELLGRQIAVLFSDSQGRPATLSAAGARQIRPFASVPNAYIVEAADPIAALDLAVTLRQTAGVKAAYPLVKRMQFPR